MSGLMRVMRASVAFLAVAAIFTVVAPSRQAMAQSDYPSRTIKIVTPFAAGAASDVALRILAEKLSQRFSVSVIVENQPGAGGVVAARAVTNAVPDGYTIAWVGNNTAIGVSLFSQPFDPRKDMRPIVGVSEFAYLFVTSETSQHKTLQDFISAAKAKPGTMMVGTSSAGTSNHLTALLFKSNLNLDFVVVPYRGPSELSVALLRKDVDLVVNAYGGLRQGIIANQIRALSTTNATRLPELPDVPTMKEVGVSDFEVTSWNALYGPKAMPQHAVDVLARAVTELLAEPDLKAKFKDIGFDAISMQPAALGERMDVEIKRWGKVISDAGLKP